MTAHAKKCPPSSADRWFYCTASVPLIEELTARGELTDKDMEKDEDITEEFIIEQDGGAYSDVVLDPDRDTSSFTAEGTVMHEVRETCLELNLDPFLFVGKTFSADGYSFTITEAMADWLVEGLDWIRQHTDRPHIERRVDLSPWLPEQFGTCDTFWLKPLRGKKAVFDLYLSDFKAGIGIPISAVENKQVMLYALGAWHYLGRPSIRKVIVNIDQPRAGGMKFDEIKFEKLMEFGEEVRRVWERIESGNVEFCPTVKGCQFCPIRKLPRGCAAYNRWILLMTGKAMLDPGNPHPKFEDPSQMDRATRYYIVKHSAAIKAWLVKLHEESLRAAIQGDPDPGSKAIAGGGGHRYFTDVEKAKAILESALGDKAYKPRALIGFTEIDNVLKPGKKKQGHPEAWDALQSFIDQPEGKPKLVAADHPSPAYSLVEKDDFDDLD